MKAGTRNFLVPIQGCRGALATVGERGKGRLPFDQDKALMSGVEVSALLELVQADAVAHEGMVRL